MRKIIIGTIVGIMSFASLATVAEARGRHGHGHHGHFHGRNVAPWIIGGAALGILGAGIAAGSYYNSYCWNERRAVYDNWGNFLGYRTHRFCR